MGKLTSFASGVGEGYLASKRYQDTQKRRDMEDKMYAKVMGIDLPAEPVQDKEDGGTSIIGRAARGVKKAWNALTGQEQEYADGGMIRPSGSMPIHHDKMDWQRQSFKK